MNSNPANELCLRNRQRTRRVNRRTLRRMVECLLRDLLAIERFELGIYLVEAPEMTRLNERFLRHAGSTDVIAFDHAASVAGFSWVDAEPSCPPLRRPQTGSRPLRTENEPTQIESPGSTEGKAAATGMPARRPIVPSFSDGIYGEIYVCVDEALIQARRFGTSWPSELARYIVHGVLHLLGYDDSKASKRRRMKREENRLLKALSRRRLVSTLYLR